jgi:antitoxin ParD1/3/4
MTTVTISLPESLKEFIEREVETKGYGNVSEYVRGLLRDAQKREADARLEELLLEGLAQSGEDILLSRQFWAELKADVRRSCHESTSPRRERQRGEECHPTACSVMDILFFTQKCQR